ncbi:MAG: HD domain-containing protein, partial [Candidatus Bipolaricaulia bacterium]
IRAIGDPQQRFKEDYLRMIRAIRCACLIGGRLSTEMSQAINQNREKIRLISWERIRDELLRLLETPRAARGIALLEEHGILELILPELLTTKGVKQPEKYHPEGDVYTHTLLALELADRLGFEPLVKLAILLHDIGKPAAYERNRGENMAGHEAMGEELAGRVGRRLRLSNEQVRIIRYLIRQHLRVAIFPEMARAKQIRFVKEDEARKRGFNDLVGRFPLFARLLQLLIADCEASVHRSSGWLPVLEAFVGLLPQFRHLEELEGARKLIDGHDILELGVEEGPEVGRILEEVYDRILSGRIASREQALKAAEELAEKDNVVG